MAALVRISVLLVAALLPVGVKAQYAAAAYILADHTSGYVLESYKPDQKRQIASLTKIATAKVVLDWAASTGTDLSQLILIPPQAIRAFGTNPIGLQPDDQMSYRDLIYSAMMESDGTAAQALAYTVGASLRSRAAGSLGELGAIEAFVTQMNALARQLGMEKTLFVNPDGLEPEKGPQPYSTAADVIKLVAYAMNDAGFRFTFLKRSGKLLLSAEVKPCNIYCATPTNCWAATAWTELKPALPPEPANVSLYLPRKTRKFARKARPPTLPLGGSISVF